MVSIRDVNENDLSELETVFKIPELRSADGYYPEKVYLSNFIGTGLFFVAEDDGLIVGAVQGEIMKGDVAYLNTLWVREGYRKKGIGGLLLAEFRKRVKAKGADYLWLLSNAKNENSHDFYRENGFNNEALYKQFVQRI